MSKKSYFEKLKDPRWQKRRLEIMERDKFTCRRCSSTERTLNVHHLFYAKGCDPWDYEDGHLLTLCEECHATTEEERISILKMGGYLAMWDVLVKLAEILADVNTRKSYLGWIAQDLASLVRAQEQYKAGEIDARELSDTEAEICRTITSAAHQYIFALKFDSLKEGD